MTDSERTSSPDAGSARERAGIASSRDGHWVADEIELGWYGRAFRERWKLLIGGALLGAVVGLSVTYLGPTLYEGVTTLLVVPPELQICRHV